MEMPNQCCVSEAHKSTVAHLSVATVDTLPLSSTKRNKACLHYPAHLA